MSLINEALKRTRDSAYQAAETSPPVAADYRPENGIKAQKAKKVVFVMGVSAVAVLAGVIVLAVWLVPRIEGVKDGLMPSKDLSIAKTPPSVSPRRAPATTALSPKAEVGSSPPAAAAAPVSDTKGAEDQIVAKVMERIKAEQPAAPSTPQLVLQGITYAPDNRDAMVNGVTVHEGEAIAGARVVAIESRRVTLNFNGQEIILRLP
jgi:hypothetical protein